MDEVHNCDGHDDGQTKKTKNEEEVPCELKRGLWLRARARKVLLLLPLPARPTWRRLLPTTLADDDIREGATTNRSLSLSLI